jgi:hypothetical protein
MSPGPDLSSVSGPSFFELEVLESYTRSEAALWNWRQHFLGSVQDWKSWIQDAWGDLLLEPAGWEIGLVQAHSVETQTERRQYNFKQREILIGREASNDVVLDTVAAGKRHARIFVEQGLCFVEDLGSSLGTYCNQEPIAPNHRRLLQSGDQVAIFPYLFTVSPRQLWSRQIDVNVYAGAAESMTWRANQLRHFYSSHWRDTLPGSEPRLSDGLRRSPAAALADRNGAIHSRPHRSRIPGIHDSLPHRAGQS